jgi:lathosterol oxidase
MGYLGCLVARRQRRYVLWYWRPISFFLVLFSTDATLYYSHRLLHHRLLFRHVHRWHHRYVAPIIFTATGLHPLEMFVLTLAQLVPAFIIPVHIGVFFAVISYTYLVGMIDHMGARVGWPLSAAGQQAFHNDHHLYFHCNYGHHTSLFDRLHGTARVAGRHYDEHTFGGKGAERLAQTDSAPVPAKAA